MNKEYVIIYTEKFYVALKRGNPVTCYNMEKRPEHDIKQLTQWQNTIWFQSYKESKVAKIIETQSKSVPKGSTGDAVRG